MLKERIKEVFEFTKSESPYRKANKGWINQDIFLDLNPPTNKVNQNDETAKITLYWAPINSLLSKIFLIIIICTILVFASISLAKGRFNLYLSNNSNIIDSVKIEEGKSVEISELNDKDSDSSITQQKLDATVSDKSNHTSSLDDDLIKDIDKNKDIKILQNNKSNSNFT